MKKAISVLGLALAAATLPAQAALLMPSFDGAPTGWVTDRYDPSAFADVGTYQGKSDVLGIGISAADGINNRPVAYQSTFYNTQGKQYAISGGAGDTLAASLYIPAEWRSEQNGNVRTDMWGVMNGGPALDYTIIGFTNYGGSARLRVWDDETSLGWVDLLTAINFDAWTDLDIIFTGSAYEYKVNGNVVYTDSTVSGATGFGATIMQAYNFCGGDPNVPNATCADYTAHWANTQEATVPEPGTIALVALGMICLLGARPRRRRA